MNTNDVRGKLDVLTANQHQLDYLRGLSRADFVADVRNLDSALHRLQTSIQALLDIGAYVVGSLNLATPQLARIARPAAAHSGRMSSEIIAARAK